jgi:hypothetical protein
VWVAGAGDLRLRHHDAFHYALMARWLADADGRALGLTWPPGFPLLGVPLVWAGLHPATALVAVNVAAFVGCMLLMDRLLAGCGVAARPRCLWLCALGGVNCWVDVVLEPMSEPLFVLATLGVIAGVARLPEQRAIGLAAVMIAAAFLARYVGAAYALLLPVTVLRRRRALARRARIGLWGASLGLVAFFGLLFAVNAERSGRLLADPARVRPGIDVALSLAALGRSVVRLPGVDWTYKLGAYGHPLRIAVGCLFVAACVVLAVRACRRADRVVQAAGFVTLAYVGGLFVATTVVFILCWAEARMTLPLLFPLALIVAPALRGARASRFAAFVLVAFVAVEAVVASRQGAMLRITEAPVREAERDLARRVRPRDVVALNLAGLNVARRIEADFRLVYTPAGLAQPVPARFVVFVEGPEGGFGPAWSGVEATRTLPDYERVSSGPQWLAFQRQRAE